MTAITESRCELQGVMGHEFSHILNGDRRLNLHILGVIFGIVFLAVIGRVLIFSRGRASRERNPLMLGPARHDNTRPIVLHLFFVTGIAFGLNYLWETIQCPLFFIHLDGKATPAVMVTATLGDVAMTWFAQVVVATVSRRWLWLLERWRWPQWTALLAVALALSFLLEYWALGTARWTYTDINPRIPGTAISALPVAQLVLLFPLTFGLTRLLLRTTAMSAWRDRTTSRKSP